MPTILRDEAHQQSRMIWHLAVFALNLAGFGLAVGLSGSGGFNPCTRLRRCSIVGFHLGVADDTDTGRSPTGGERRDGQCQLEMPLAGEGWLPVRVSETRESGQVLHDGPP
jgi:hypothetical protein